MKRVQRISTPRRQSARSLPLLQVSRPEPSDRDRLAKLLARFRQRRLLIVGDVGVDRYTQGTVERISPEAPVPIVWVQSERLKLGLAANVAENVCALAARASLVGVVGMDHSGRELKRLCRERGVDVRGLVVDSARRTTVKERIVSDRQQLLRIDYESQDPIGRTTHQAVQARLESELVRCDAVIVEDYAKGLLESPSAQAWIRRARAQDKWVSVDPNAKGSLEAYAHCSVMTPNTKEAEALSGIEIRDDASLVRAGQRLLDGARCEAVVITRGGQGMALFERGTRRVTTIPTAAREVYDVSGAGDTVIAVLTLALASGASLVEACWLGNLAAGVVVGKLGTATVAPEELKREVDLLGL